MNRPRLIAIVAGVLGIAGIASADEPAGKPGGYTPEEAVRRMVVPEGFRVEVFAAEPDIRQPVAACFDERGRMWVVEYLQYPNPNGLKPVSVDVYLRTEYDRVPEPPPHGPRGADRIKILEDTDGDGRADKSTVFVEGLNLASAVAVGHGGVFVAQAPYLLFYPDLDRDDRPDGDPQVLLTGFGLQDAHAVVNSLTWGPDGWLYGAQGSTVTADIRGIGFQQGIWRYHPITREFELFAEGGGNTWGLDFDRAGNAFGSSNSGFVAFHMVQGGYYWKGFAKHGPLHNPRTFGYFDALAYDGPKRGGHVTPGGIIYRGDNFPESFRNTFIGGNLLANAVYWHDLSPMGSTFGARHGGTLLDAHDAWFRPIDLLTGPDGCVYLVDWYDKRASHLDPRDNWDKTNGRIYRIVYGERPKVEPFDLSRWPTAKLLELRDRPNSWWPDEARRLLYERRDGSAIEPLRRDLAAERDEAKALLDLTLLNACGGLDQGGLVALLDHPVAVVRRWAVRLLGDAGDPGTEGIGRLVDLAGEESDPLVRSQLASSCQRWSPSTSLPILSAMMAADSGDRTDPHIPLLEWWAIERAMRADPAMTQSFMLDQMTAGRPLALEQLIERYARALAAEASPESLDRAAEFLRRGESTEGAVSRIVAGLEKGLEGRTLDRSPEALARALGEATSGGDPALRLAARLGDPSAFERVLKSVSDDSTAQAPRVEFIRLLGELQEPEGRGALLRLLADSRPEPIRAAAIDALAADPAAEIADALLDHYEGFSPSLRSKAIDRLVGRASWASRLLDALADGRIDPKAITAAQAQQVARLGDEALTNRLTEVWGIVPGPGSEAKVQRIAEVRGILPEGDKGDPARGVAIFRQQCAGCHKLFGEGESIGPELTGAERGNLDFLLQSLVDPSALIRKEYQPMTVATSDGRVLNGMVVEESDAAITLFDSQKNRTVIPRDAIEEMTPSPVSIMPEGLLDPLPDDQVRDLLRYLQSGGPR